MLCQGDKITPYNRHTIEPMTAWRYSDPQSKKFKSHIYMPKLHKNDRSFWRGLSSLLPHALGDDTNMKSSAAKSLTPGIIRWASVIAVYLMQKNLSVQPTKAIGIVYGNQNAVVDDLIDDQLELPIALLSDEDGKLTKIAIDAVSATENAVKALENLAGGLAQASGSDSLEGPKSAARTEAYAALDFPFRNWLKSLSALDEDLESIWYKQARAIIWAIGQNLLVDAGSAAWAGRIVEDKKYYIDSVRCDITFRTQLNKALPRVISE